MPGYWSAIPLWWWARRPRNAKTGASWSVLLDAVSIVDSGVGL